MSRAAGVLPLLALAAAGLAPAGAAAPAAPPSFTVSVDRTKLGVGDRARVTYEARIPEGARVEVEAYVSPRLPGPQEGSGPVLGFSVEGPATLEKAGAGSAVWRQTVDVVPFASGDVPLPGPHLVFVAPDGSRTAVRPPAALLQVSSRLPSDKKPEELAPRDDRDVRIPARPWWFWALLALAALAAGLVVLWLVRRRRRSSGAGALAAAPEVPLEVEFGAALDRLAASAGTLEGDPRPFYTDLTHATKRFLERHLSLPVLEWTTFETVKRLREAGWEAPREVGLAEILGSADRVKFGRGAATRADALEHVERARRLLSYVEAERAAAAARAEKAEKAGKREAAR